MSYVHESLSPGEKIFKLSQYHWMYIAGAFVGAFLFVFMGLMSLFLGIIYHYYDIVKVPPWMIHKAAAELAFRDYLNAFWHTNVLFRGTGFVFFLLAFVQVGARLLVRATTEMAVTNRRAVLKRGIIARKVEEMRIDYIEGADVNQTMLGRMFNYGQVKVYGTGTESIFYPVYTSDPVNFRRALEAARNTLPPAGPQPRPAYEPTEDSHPVPPRPESNPQQNQKRMAPRYT